MPWGNVSISAVLLIGAVSASVGYAFQPGSLLKIDNYRQRDLLGMRHCETQLSLFPDSRARNKRRGDVLERKQWLETIRSGILTTAGASPFLSLLGPQSAEAAPPMAVIAEELGYFPVTNRSGDTTYIPGRVKSKSTVQAIELSEYLAKSGAVMYGAFWCPHCQRQREMFGREAWANINYVECAKNGVSSNVKLCTKQDVTGFPTWKFPKFKEEASGEMPLAQLAKVSHYKGTFDGSLEPELSSGMSGSCG
jgi:hypothetical protein